jgi:hypothetical protein
MRHISKKAGEESDRKQETLKAQASKKLKQRQYNVDELPKRLYATT